MLGVSSCVVGGIGYCQSMTPNGQMPSVRLYLTARLELHESVALEQKQAHYLSHVMRRKEGDWVLLFNETDGEWLAEITVVSKKAMQLRCLERTRAPSACPDCWLVCAPLKSGHMEIMIQKATELGVSNIVPVKTRHLALKRINPERLFSVAVEAAEQSERLDVPPVREMQDIEQVMADWPQDRPLFYGDETGQGIPMQSVLAEYAEKKPKQWAVMVGPEGGFADNELALLHKHPAAIAVTLGPRILRADTASTTLLSLTQSMFGDWHHQPAFRGMT